MVLCRQFSDRADDKQRRRAHSTSSAIGAAGGIGGFYLPVVLGIARDTSGNYGSGFLFLAAVAALACVSLLLLRARWRI